MANPQYEYAQTTLIMQSCILIFTRFCECVSLKNTLQMLENAHHSTYPHPICENYYGHPAMLVNILCATFVLFAPHLDAEKGSVQQ